MSRARRTLLRAVVAVPLALALVLVVNTLRMRPRPRPSLPPAPPPAVAGEVIAAHLAEAIRIDTVSHEDARHDDPQKLRALREHLARTYPAIHAAAPPELVGECSLLFTWKGTDPALRPALLAAHQDVVPIEPGTEGAWRHPPFAGVIEGGFVWGRGALDDKGSLIEILEAADSLARERFAPRRTTFIALGCDEEVGGARGAVAIAKLLGARGVRLEYALDEGMAVTEGVVPDVARQVALIGLGEKGYVSVELSVEMPGGHSSMPPRETAVSVIAAAVDRVSRAPMPARLTSVSRGQMEALAPFMPFGKRLGIANLWLLEPLVLRTMERQPVTNAAIRTTAAPTIIEGGVKENVLPSRARAVINHRILPGDTIEGVLAHVRAAIGDARVRVRAAGSLDGDPPRLSDRGSRAYQLIESTIARLYPDAVIVPALVLGATDARHYTSLADGVYHFVPFVLHGAEERESVHGTNERIRVADLITGVSFYREIIKDGR